MSWADAGIPAIGGQILSGAQTIVFKGSRYLVEHPIPGMEGGIVENLGKPLARLEIHGIVYESGADQMLATLSGFIGTFKEIHIPSFNSGFYFIQSGVGITFENLKFVYDPGRGYPFYHYIIAGVMSGEFLVPFVSLPSGAVLTAITYTVPFQMNAQVQRDYVVPFATNAQIYIGYTVPFQQNAQIYGSYAMISGVSGY